MTKIALRSILFLDIETVSWAESFEKLDPVMQKLRTKKAEKMQREDKEISAQEKYLLKAGIFSEFAKIICIAVGFFKDDNLVIRSFVNEDEFTLLADFSHFLEQSRSAPQAHLCAHNGKEFDFPFLARRLIINQLAVPAILFSAEKKPREVNHLDTMVLRKFWDHKNYTPLELLTVCLWLPSPKDDIDGSQVSSLYRSTKDLARISTYCQKDVLALVQVYLRLTSQSILSDSQILFS